MAKYSILHSRFKLSSVKKNFINPNLLISEDKTKILAYNDGNNDGNNNNNNKWDNVEKVVKNTEIIFCENYSSFMDVKLVDDKLDNWYSIYLIIDGLKLEKIMENAFAFKNRKNFFELIKKCYSQCYCNYISHLTLNVFENTIKNRFSSFDQRENRAWFENRENSQNILSMLPRNIFKIGNLYADLTKGRFLKGIARKNFRLSGGIIIDRNETDWIDYLIRLPKKVEDHNDFYSNATLIICNPALINIWIDKIKDLENLTYKVIINQKDHCSVTYDIVSNYDFIIVSTIYLLNKNYSKLWQDYQIDSEIPLEEIFEIMRADATDIKKIGTANLPIFSLLKWERLIIDNFCFQKMNSCPKFLEIINSMKSCHRWIQISQLSPLKDDILNYVSFLINEKDINYPIYSSKNNIHILDDLVCNINKNNKKSCSKRETISVQMQSLEQTLHNYYEEVNFLGLASFHDNLLLLNSKEIGNINFNSRLCLICFEEREREEMIVTDCQHVFCLKCCLLNIHFNSNCPFCRHSLTIKEISCLKIEEDGKLNILSNLIMNNRGKSVILCNENYIKSITEYLGNKGFKCENSIGGYKKRLTKINSFNKSEEKNCFILGYNCYQMARSFSNIKNIIYYQLNDVITNSFKTPICNGAEMNEYFLVYKNSFEESKLKDIEQI